MEASQYEVPATLKDGTEIVIRAISSDDSGSLREQFVKHLSTESVRLRFHGLRRAPSESETFRLTNIDFVDHVALCGNALERSEGTHRCGQIHRR